MMYDLLGYIAPPDYPVVDSVEDGVDYAYGTLTGTLPATCDYPAESDVKFGVTYGFSVYTGTYTPFGNGGIGDGINLNQVIGAVRYRLITDGIFTVDEIARENKPFTGVADPYFIETFTPSLEVVNKDNKETEQRGMIQYTIVSNGGTGTYDAYELHRKIRNSLMTIRIETTKSHIYCESVDVVEGVNDQKVFNLGIRINLLIRSIIS